MTLRHTTTAFVWSFFLLFPSLFGVLDVVLGTAAVVTGSFGALMRVAGGVVYLTPLVVLWRTRVVLAPGAVVLVNGLRTRRLPVGEITDVRVRSWGWANWRTLIELHDGQVVQAWGLTATKLGPLLAGDPEPRSRSQSFEGLRRPPPDSLLRRADELRVHVGLGRW